MKRDLCPYCGIDAETGPSAHTSKDACISALKHRNQQRIREAVHPVMAALHELYTSCGYLRLRCEIHAEKLKGFSDWESNTKAMRIAEDVLKRSNTRI